MGRGEVAIVLAFEDERRKRFVLARHTERGWEIPGGWIEDDETPREAAQREFREEIGHELVDPEPVLVHEREGAPVCHVFAAQMGPPTGSPEAEDDKVRDWRIVDSLEDVDPLAFPDDPYEQIEAELGVQLREREG